MTNAHSLFFFCLLGMSVIVPSRTQAQPIHSLDRIVAVVDESVILQSALDRAVANVRQQYAGHAAELPPAPILERQVLERLIMIQLQTERAKSSGIHVSEDALNRAIASIAAQNKTSLDGLRAQLAHDGLSYAQFRQSVRDEILIQQLRQNFAMSRIVVSDRDVDAALTAAAQKGTQYHLAHILIQLPEGASAQQIAAAQRNAEEIKTLIDSGKIAFSAAAVRYSQSPNALDGGDLGFRGLQEIPSAFTTLIQEMTPGQTVGPIRGPSGFQLLRLIEKRDGDAALAQSNETQYRVRHLLIRPSASRDAAAAKAKIESLYARILHGASFEAIARKQSDDPASQNNGGDMGWFSANAYGADFARHIAALHDGQLSQPFLTDSGWHLIQRLGERHQSTQDAERRAQMRETIGQHKLDDAYNRFLLELRNEAYVTIRQNGGEEQAPSASDAQSTPAAAQPSQPSGE